MSTTILEALVISAAYSVACLSAGALLVRLLLPDWWRTDPPIWAALGTAFLVGEAVLSQVWLLIALAGQYFTKPVVIGVLAVCVLGGFRFVGPLIGRSARAGAAAIQNLDDEALIWKTMVALLVVIVILTGIQGLVQYVHYDAVAHYMALPKLIAASHEFVLPPATTAGTEGLNQVGVHGEMHFAVLHLFGLETKSKIFGWYMGLGIAVMVVGLGQRLGVRRKGLWLALFMTFTSTALLHGMTEGKVDIFAAGMSLGAFYWALDAQNCRARCLMGLFAGLAVVAKASYLAVLAPALLIIVFWQHAIAYQKQVFRRHALRELVTGLLWIGVWAGVAFIPHFIKNAIWFDNPLLPFVGDNGLRDSEWVHPDVTRYARLVYLFAQTYGSYPMQTGNISALILACLPLVLLIPRQHRSLRSPALYVAISALVGMLVGVVIYPEVFTQRVRYQVGLWLALIPAVAGAAAYILESDRCAFRRIGQSLLLAAALMLIFTVSYQSGILEPFGKTLECEQTGCVYMLEAEYGTGYRALTQLNEQADRGDRIFLTMRDKYWLRSDLMACLSDLDELTTVEALPTSEERWTYLHDQGFRYVLLHWMYTDTPMEFLNPDAAPDWLTVTVINRDDHIYRLEAAGPDQRLPSRHCVQVDPPRWDVVANTP
ncbi:MAG: hypothetical protein JXQ72_11615 [Anaerolineae bacterium]|nr:hypothetical protein [Anaerolineae bacterium]